MRAILTLLMLSVFAGSALAGELQSCFTPGEDCAGEIVAALAAARHEVRVQAYGFTAPVIVEALVEARRRGVDVEVILDRGALAQRREEDAAQSLIRGGIPVLVDGAHAIAHNKVMVIDRTRVVTGSYNFTAAAQRRNAENLLIVQDSMLAGQYAANWSHHAAHSLPLSPTRTAAVRDDDQ